VNSTITITLSALDLIDLGTAISACREKASGTSGPYVKTMCRRAEKTLQELRNHALKA
jgi:hypothetical protein